MKLSIRTGATRVLLGAALAGVAACGADSATGVAATPAQIRVVNSVFQYTDATSSASKTTPRAIDILIDSSTSAPGIAAIPANSVVPGGGTAFEPIDPDVHTFVARLAGDTGPTSTFYTNASNLPYLPHQYLTGGTPYTLVVAGIVPVTPAAGAPITLVPATAAPFAIVTNDPFAPPNVNGTYQARFTVINAAPFTVNTGLGSTLVVYLTPGTTAPTSVTALTAAGSALYRSASAYINADAGSYVLTLTVGTGATAKIVAQSGIVLAAGEVRSIVVQSTGYAATPSPANAVIKSLLDKQY